MYSMTLLKRFLPLFKTATFRLALVFALVFGVGSAGMLLALDLAISRFAEAEMRQALQHQMAIMRADANLEGGQALINILNEHNQNDDLSRYSYYVVTPEGQSLNDGLPPEVKSSNVWGVIDFSIPRPNAEPEIVTMMVRTEYAKDGTFMAVGRNTESLHQLRKGLNNVALWGGIGLIMLALTAAMIAGHLFLRRLDKVNAVAARLIDSNLSERLPAIGFGSEFDTLANNLNHMLDRLEASNTALRQMSADIAHDLRTPLTHLRNRLEEAAHTGQPEIIEGALNDCDEMLHLFNALLRLARIESGEMRKSFQTVDLTALVDKVMEIYEPVAEQSGKTLRSSAPSQIHINGDTSLLQLMLGNLVDNAIAHTPPETTIAIDVRSSGNVITLSVSDNGPGVPDSEKENITKRFYRLDKSRTTPGYGLGLPLVIAIAELHKAEWSITDNNPGLHTELLFSTSI
ncbi:MAG: ATP-binding protein [Asticcacaulis sp.]